MNQEAQAQALADEIKRLAQQWALAEVRLEAAIDRLAAMAQTPAGWVMAPVEPTQEMLFAVRNGPMRETWADGYRAMLSAAPNWPRSVGTCSPSSPTRQARTGCGSAAFVAGR